MVGSKGSLSDLEVASVIDHTDLRALATESDIAELCAQAAAYGFAAVCVNPRRVALAARELDDSGVGVCSVVGFPLGANTGAIKAAEAEQGVNDGATEIDMVIDLGAASAGDWSEVADDIAAVRHATDGTVLKVIVEASALTAAGLDAVTDVVLASGADYIKTSTGMHPSGGARLSDVRAMVGRIAVGSTAVEAEDRLKIKAAGGIRDLAALTSFVDAGAHRIGTSAGVAIMRET